jgi:hypothetical protein
VGKILGLIGVQERVDEVNCEEDFVVHLFEESSKVILARAWPETWFIGAAISRDFNNLALQWWVLSLDWKSEISGHAEPIVHIKSLKFGLYCRIALPMIKSTWLQLELNTVIIGFTRAIVHFNEIDVEISFPFVEVVMPYLYSEHEIPAISTCGIEGEFGWIICVGAAAGGYDAHHIESIEYLVREDCHECHH